MIYRVLIRPLLYLLPAEAAHHIGFGALRWFTKIPGVMHWLRSRLLVSDGALQTHVLGRDFPNPVGLAAGFDKDAKGFEALGALGFGHVEVGTLTGQPQPGNETPRLFRVVEDRALINRMGFNNEGSEAAVARLEQPRDTLVGVNIGKTKRVEPTQAAQDYVTSARRVGRLADYVVVNVSSPNTPGLRDLQSVEKLRPLLRAVRAALDEGTQSDRVALLVKIAPDLADEDIDAIADLVLELRLDGVIATNTTISREGLKATPARVANIGAGGLSGAPLKLRSLEVLERLRQRLGDRVTLIAVGGIETAEDAWARILAGASLVQVYTAFVYEGPFLASRIARGLARLAREAGFERVQDAVGQSERHTIKPHRTEPRLAVPPRPLDLTRDDS